jgi:uncharacterized protein
MSSSVAGSESADRRVPPLDGAGWRCVDELYLLPEGDGYILYAPLVRALLLVNEGAVWALQDLRRGKPLASGAAEAFLRQLAEEGVVREAGAPGPPRPPPSPPAGELDPDGVTLLLTTACTLRCVYCYSSGGERPRTMEWEVARAAIDWIADHAAARGRRRFFVHFHGGGEVTTAADLLARCVDYARARARAQGAAVSFQSGLNGVARPEVIDWVIENLGGATVSLDGLPEIHDRQRPLPGGGGSFAQVAATLHRMDARGFPYAIRATVTADGLSSLADSVEWMASRFGAASIQAEPVFPAGRARTSGLSPVDPQAFVREFRRARRRARAHGKELRYSGARFQTLSDTFCRASSGAFAVTPEGFATSCYEVTEPADPRSALFFFGRLERPAMRFTFDRERLLALGRLRCENSPFCARCFCRWHCAGDCPAKLAAAGDPLDPSSSPRCQVNRELTRDQLREHLDLA